MIIERDDRSSREIWYEDEIYAVKFECEEDQSRTDYID